MTTLKLDYDTPRYPARCYWRVMWLARKLGWTLAAFGVMRSQRGGWHVEVVVRQAVDALTVVAAQAILGSHWAREAHNLARVHSPAYRSSALWRARANVLYECHQSRRLV